MVGQLGAVHDGAGLRQGSVQCQDPGHVAPSLRFHAKGGAAQTEPPVAGRLFVRGDELLELVEAVRPTIPVKRAALLGLERALREDNLRRFAEIPK